MARVKSIRALIDTARSFKENPRQVFEITGIWPTEHWTLADFRRWFLRCLQDKINRHDRRTWRKLVPDYQRNLSCDARIINDYHRRVMHRGLNVLRTPEMKRRYPHINNNLPEV